MGVDGIVFPFIRTAEEAKRAVKSCLYPPEGIRGFGPIRAIKYGMDNIDEYIKKSGNNLWKIMQIEHVDAVNNLDEILSIDGVDAIVAGPNDLSASIGLLGQHEHPNVRYLMDLMAEKASLHGKPFGVSMGYISGELEEWLKRGINWAVLGSDVGYILKASKKDYENAKNEFYKYYSHTDKNSSTIQEKKDES
ncbi:MAG: aldolase/citrate lyase family protein [Clostridiales bacterium]|nr:aldolase/citrate lyase family protein [Clostridiales bacterium]